MANRYLWSSYVVEYARSLFDRERGLASSVTGGPVTLYGSCYALQVAQYLSQDFQYKTMCIEAIRSCQEPETGLFRGPELTSWCPPEDALHDEEHLLYHLTCAVLPVLQDSGVEPQYPIRAAHAFCDRDYLKKWLEQIDWKDAWFEGNNLLFVGQLLLFLRDHEQQDGAAASLEYWFDWLDHEIDPATGLWGTNGFCGIPAAVYGGYHQLLMYYHEKRPIQYPAELVDAVLSLQHPDGGFRPGGGGGACEDVDAVDILVNVYKRHDVRRPAIRAALRRCVRHILAAQNPDGGFSYARGKPYIHMGIPSTANEVGQSGAFPTWFRVHTLALIAQVLPNEPALRGIPFSFSRHLSMGWHDTDVVCPTYGVAGRMSELGHTAWWGAKIQRHHGRQFVRRVRKRLGRQSG